MKPKLHIIIGSTRPGRVGPGIAQWFSEFTAEHGKFEPVLVDLAEFNLPVFDEPEHPMKQNYRTCPHQGLGRERALRRRLRVRDAGIQLRPALVPHQRVELSVAGVELCARRLRELWRHLGRPARRPDGEADRDDAEDDADSGRRADADGLPRTWTRPATSSPSTSTRPRQRRCSTSSSAGPKPSSPCAPSARPH